MNTSARRLIPFLLTLVIVVLVNAASTTLFFRADLTRDNVYSLSDASIRTVATLEEPLTIKAFFSPNLPAPYNNTAQAVRDLLEEYAVEGNRFFNYTITTVPPQDAASPDALAAEESEARKYRIFPIQVQNVQQDEVKLQTVYMGLAFIHGDMLETIPALTSVESLEYQITSIINKMSNKISALLSMKENIEVVLYLTPNLDALGSQISSLPETIRGIVSDLNEQYYGRLAFSHLDPTTEGTAQSVAQEFDFSPLTLRRRVENQEVTETAYAAVVVRRGSESYSFNLISRGIFGMQMADSETLKQSIKDSADSLIGVTEEVAFATGYGIPSLEQNQAQQSTGQQLDLTNFQRLVSNEYSLREVALDREAFPKGLKSLFVVGPTEKLSDYALFQIDQFLMNGGSLMVFLDSHRAVATQQSQFGGAQQMYIPLDTGVAELLRHYGLDMERAYVMDEECFTQRQRSATGGIVETPIYFAPIVSKDRISNESRFTRNVPDMVVLNVAPLNHDDAAPGAEPDVNVIQVLRSSPKAWTVSENIDLSNPYAIQPPPDDMRDSYPLALLAEGTFSSYFAGKPVPEPPEPTNTDKEQSGDAAGDTIAADTVSVEEDVKEQGNGRIFVIGSSVVLGSNLLDAEGNSGNSLFLLNLVDYMNDRVDYAMMRTKGVGYSPLEETTPAVRSFIKTFNIAGLALIVAAVGLLVFLVRTSRKRRIQAHFQGTEKSREGVEG